MARIRTIKPEFPQSESMGQCTRDARLTFLLLFTMSDDAGRLRANSRMLASLLYPYDDDAKKGIGSWLGELEKVGCIHRYQVDGDSYLAINKWTDHQKIDKPTPSKLPAPPESSRILATVREDSFTPADSPSADRKGRDRNVSTPPEGVSAQIWADYVAHRKTKKAAISATVIESLKTDAASVGLTLEQAMEMQIKRGWTGFDPSWVTGKQAANQSGGILAGAI